MEGGISPLKPLVLRDLHSIRQKGCHICRPIPEFTLQVVEFIRTRIGWQCSPNERQKPKNTRHVQLKDRLPYLCFEVV